MNGERLYNMYRRHFLHHMGIEPLAWEGLAPEHRDVWDTFASTIRTQIIAVVRKAMEEAGTR